MAGNRILVSKRNMIIPTWRKIWTEAASLWWIRFPHVCPCVDSLPASMNQVERAKNGENRIIKTLYCDNPDCETRRLKKFVHFVSQKAMDIEGLSEATLEKIHRSGIYP